MADYINNLAAADKYTEALTLGPSFAARSAVITVANNPALMQFAVGGPADWHWTDEREYFSIPQAFKVGNIVGVKFRNANPGQAARILAVLAAPDDIQFESGLPFTSIITATGGVIPAGTLPSGVIFPYGGLVAPTGFVLCDGSAYDGRVAGNANLWAAIGNTYGGVDITAFNVPDLRGRVPVGLGTNAAVNARGQNDGVALANRRGLAHRHTPHTHTTAPVGLVGAAPQNAAAGAAVNSVGNFAGNINAADGGSGVATDPLDGGAFLVVNYIIAL